MKVASARTVLSRGRYSALKKCFFRRECLAVVLILLLVFNSLVCAEKNEVANSEEREKPLRPQIDKLSPSAAAVAFAEAALERRANSSSSSLTSRSLTEPPSQRAPIPPSPSGEALRDPLLEKEGKAKARDPAEGDAFVSALRPRGSRGFPTPAQFVESFEKFSRCAEEDARCIYELAVHFFLGRPPLTHRSLEDAVRLLWLAERKGSADAQYMLAILHQNLFLLPRAQPFKDCDERKSNAPSAESVRVNADFSLSFFSADGNLVKEFCDGGRLSAFARKVSLLSGSRWPLLDFVQERLRVSLRSWLSHWRRGGGSGDAKSKQASAAPSSLGAAMKLFLTAPDFSANPSLPMALLFAASTASHPGASAALAWKIHYSTLRGSVGQQQQACTAAANFLLPVAKRTAGVYAAGIPQAIERLSLHSPWASVSATGSATGVDDSFHRRLSADPEQLTLLLQEAGEGNLKVHSILGRKFLFGLDGFPQDFTRARFHLLTAARSHRGDAMSLLGYVYALGLGVEADLDEAAEWFYRGARENDDPIAYNGLGFIHFFGSRLVDPDPSVAFQMFNKSAHLDSPDGQLNLASLYLTGTVRGGSSGAAYALAVMHLSGLGASRDCQLALSLLKLVTERGGFFAYTLQKAYAAYEQRQYNEAAWNFLLLAEAGHETLDGRETKLSCFHLGGWHSQVSQSNLAFLLDTGLTDLFFDGTLSRKRLHAQRFYEMSAAQGSAFSHLRLGDFAYHGFGVRRRSWPINSIRKFQDESGAPFDGMLYDTLGWLDVETSDFEEAAARYRRVAELGTWASAQASQARYNLGVMHLFGLGVPQDLYLAQGFFNKSLEGEGVAPTAPVYVGLAMVYLTDIASRLSFEAVVEALSEDPRLLMLLLNVLVLLLLIFFRAVIQRLRLGVGLTDAAFRAARTSNAPTDQQPTAPSSNPSASPGAEDASVVEETQRMTDAEERDSEETNKETPVETTSATGD